MTVLEKVKHLISQFEKTNERIYGVDALHLLDKFLNTHLFSKEGNISVKPVTMIKCEDCGSDVIAKAKTRKICNQCANKRKIKAAKLKKLER
ncbi:MAG TPA: hypothetical protein PKI46_02565 [Bacteroidales bacterium]|nr:hypothetical protein [Bacteroidales bacterium]